MSGDDEFDVWVMEAEEEADDRSMAAELCALCQGDACEEGCGRGGRSYCADGYGGPNSHRVCRRCGGSGVVIEYDDFSAARSDEEEET